MNNFKKLICYIFIYLVNIFFALKLSIFKGYAIFFTSKSLISKSSYEIGRISNILKSYITSKFHCIFLIIYHELG